MARSAPLLTDEQWQKIAPLLPRARKNPRGGVRRPTTGGCWRGSSGFCEAGRVGRTCRNDTRLPRPAGDDCNSGRRSGSRSGGPSWGNWTSGANWTGARCSSMAVSLRRKRGRQSRENQAGQGHEVDGGGRPPGSSFGKLPGLCVPGGGPTRGKDTEGDPGSLPPGPNQTATQTATIDRGYGL